MIKLEAPFEQIQTTTFLPSSDFNNRIAPVIEITRKVSMNNVTHTHVKRKGRYKLTLTITMRRAKAFELQAFVESYLTADIRVTLEDGDIWKVKFSNNPFEYVTGTRGAVLTVNLEFQGIKIYGTESDC